MSKPEISVIVPIYKTAPYLSACLDSVLAQTFEDYEIICINDGSPDNAMDILNQYAQRRPKIRFYYRFRQIFKPFLVFFR